eukprot:scaffold17175_cov126-Skeletonema_dohrnii-CCMP3373.AAC.1
MKNINLEISLAVLLGQQHLGAVSTVRSSTEGFLTYSEKTLSLLRGANVHEAVELLNLFWNKNMNHEERVEAFAVVV